MAKILDMADEQQMVLRTEDLVKKYKTRTVVNHVSINVKQGEIVGLLGPNGAGKTTTFYMTVGLVTPNEGKIFLNDMEITKFPVYKRARNGIGYLAQEASIFRKMTVEDPKFIMLDEPFAGVDPIAVQDIQSIVAKLKHKNIGILITDHNVYETLSICDRAYLLFEGKVLFQGTAEQLAENEIVREKYLGKDFVLRKKDF